MVVPGTDGVSPPSALLAMTTAIAPAAAALLVLIAKLQPPRRTTAIAPAKAPAENAAQPSLALSMPALTRSGVVPGMAALCATPLVPSVRISGDSGSGTGAGPVTDINTAKLPRPCCAAAVEPTHGSRWPIVFGPGPLLPAEAAT